MAVRNSLVAPVLGDQLTKDPSATARIAKVEAILGHRFVRPELIDEALTHRSAALSTWAGKRTQSHSNERLEFVGDRVLGLLVAEWLAERYPRENEGGLGRRLARLVSQPVLADIADRLGLAAALSVSPSESKAGVRKLATVLADAMEAVIGALYLDAGIEPARAFVRRAFETALTSQVEPPKDAKTTLQEWALHRGMALPVYHVTSSTGPSHAPVFEMSVTVAGQTGVGSGSSKRQAEQDAAHALLERLRS
jgi:ribonuclease-3